MLARDPTQRPSFDRVLAEFRGTIFPEYFYTFLQEYNNALSELPESSDEGFLARAASQPGNKIDRILEEWGSVSVHLEGTEADPSE
jgi:phosphoinositide-3-kinase regulatory subunit 4